MNYSKCMLKECKVCKYKERCFKDEYTENRHTKAKTRVIQRESFNRSKNNTKKVMEVGDMN